MARKSPEAINTFSSGMNMDLDKSLLKNNQYRYAENVRCIANTDSSTGSLTNIEGPSLVSVVSIPPEETIIATDTIRDKGVIFTTRGGEFDIVKKQWYVSLLDPITQEGSVFLERIPDPSNTYRSNGYFLSNQSSGYQNGTKIIKFVPFEINEYANHEVLSIRIYDAVRSDLNGTYTKYDGVSQLPGNFFYVDNLTGDYVITKDIPETVRVPGESNFTGNLYLNNVLIDTETHDYAYYYNEGKIEIEWSFYINDNPLAISSISRRGELGEMEISTAVDIPWNGATSLELIVLSSNYISGTYTVTKLSENSFYVPGKTIVQANFTPNVSDYEKYLTDKTKLFVTNMPVGATSGDSYEIDLISTLGDEVGPITSGTATYIATGELVIDGWIDDKTSQLPPSGNIYRVDNTNGIISLNHLVGGITFDFGFNVNSKLSLVCRYEDDDNIKVYWADGVNPIRMINILGGPYTSITDANYFNVTMPLLLDSPEIVGLGTGRLNAGVIQYAYQLSSIQGSLSRLSLLSPQISLSKTTQNTPSSEVLGDDISTTYGEPTGKSVKVRVPIDNPAIVDRIRLISIYSYNYSEVPVITIVKDIPTNGKSTMILEDGGVSAIGELTLAEFNAIGGNIPIASQIESKDDILFAADIKENQFEADYDTRAYQFKSPTTTIPGYTIPASISPSVSLNEHTLNIERITDYAGTKFKISLPVGIIGSNISLSGWVVFGTVSDFSWPSGYLMPITSIDISTNIITLDGGIDNSISVTALKIRAPFTYVSEQVFPPTESSTGTCLFKIVDNDGTVSPDMPLSAVGQIASDHGCIHPEIYTVEDYRDIEYRYNKDGKLGGTGPNVSYLFTNTKFIESYSDVLGKNGSPGINRPSSEKDIFIDRRYPRIGDVKRDIISVAIINSDGSDDTSYQNLATEFGVERHFGPLNYANPLIANKFKSYQRDEIYRFAAVFRDKGGRKTDAKWIADIRFPAGYYSDSSWNARIFEMPEENYQSNSMFGKQELIVNPLGVKFSFKNLPQEVKSVEIVRSKRDINNKTIYSQGVVQKTGTYFNDYKLSLSDRSKNNRPVDGTILPHPIIAMGYNYSLLGPTMEVQDSSINNRIMRGALPTLFTSGGSDTFRYAFKSLDEYGQSNDVRFDFTKHVYSPYFSNKNIFMFVCPEASYYGNDFSSQIESMSGGLKLNMTDIIFPVSTPVLDSSNNNYYGKSIETTFKSAEINGGIEHAMYFGADINANNVNTNTNSSDLYFSTFGLVSVDKSSVSNPLTGGLNDILENDTPFDKLDVSAVIGKGLTNNESLSSTVRGYVRAFISTGGLIANLDHEAFSRMGYFSGANSDPATRPILRSGIVNSDAPPLVTSNNILKGCIGGTFKYYRSIGDSATWASGGNNWYTEFVYQTGNLTDNRKILKTTNPFKVTDQNIGIFPEIEKMPLSFSISEIKYSGDIEPGGPINTSAGLYYKNIHGRRFLNWSRALTYGDDRNFDEDNSNVVYSNSVACAAATKAQGIHGDGLIFSVDDQNVIPSLGKIGQMDRYAYSKYTPQQKKLDRFGSAAMSTYVMNLKKMNSSIYGGNTYSDRQYTEYISTGFNKKILNGNELSMHVFGGDTFIGIFDYTVIRATDPIEGGTYKDDASYDSEKFGLTEVLMAQTKHIGAMIPLESSINLHMPSSKSYVNQGCQVGILRNVGSNGIALNAGGSYVYSQSLPQYKYNAAYSSEQTVSGYMSRLGSDELNNVFDCRVINSGVKSNDELYDSWSTFKPADYIDVDTRYGKITRLKTFDNRLYFWQEHAVGVLSVNERSLIQDNNTSALVLGTGGILTRFDYVSNNNGIHKNSINSLYASPSSLYWYDHDRGELITMNKGSDSLSKAKGIQSMLNKNKNVIEYNVPITYDRKYNEVIFSFYGISDPKLLD